jgi:hypothetical protein
MRKRLREQRRLREARLLDLGALVYELHRQGKRAPELLQEKAAELSLIDDEVRQLEDALDGTAPEQMAEEPIADEPEPDEAEQAELEGSDEAEPAEAPEAEQPTQEADALEADPLQPHGAEEPA